MDNFYATTDNYDVIMDNPSITMDNSDVTPDNPDVTMNNSDVTMTSPLAPHLADYAVICASLLPCLGFACICGFRRVDVHEYLYGSLQVSGFSLALSITSCLISVVTVQGLSAEVYYYGVSHALILMAAWGAIIGFSIFTPVLHPLRLKTIYEYVEKRFQHSAPKYLAMMLGIVSMVVSACISVYSPALALHNVCGVCTWVSILVITTVATCTTTIGGFRAVIWSNALHVLFIIFILLGLIAAGIVHLFEVVPREAFGHLDQLLQHPKFQFSNLTPDPLTRGTIWQLTIAQGIAQMALITLQPLVLRITAARSLVQARVTGGVGVLLAIFVTFLLVFLGLLILVTDLASPSIQHGPMQNISTSYQLVYLYVNGVSDAPGMTGVCAALILATSLSSMCNLLNALTTVLWDEILIKPCANLSDRCQTFILKLITFLLGVAIMCLCLAIHWSQELLPSIYQLVCLVFTSSGGAVFAIIFCAAAFPCMGPWPVTVGALIAAMSLAWESAGASLYRVTWFPPAFYGVPSSNATAQGVIMYSGMTVENGPFIVSDSFYTPRNITQYGHAISTMLSVSPYLYHAFGFATALIIAILLSIIPGCRQKNTNPKYLFGCCRCCAGDYSAITGDDVTPKRNSEADKTTEPENHDEPNVTMRNNLAERNLDTGDLIETDVKKRHSRTIVEGQGQSVSRSRADPEQNAIQLNPEQDNHNAGAALRDRSKALHPKKIKAQKKTNRTSQKPLLASESEYHRPEDVPIIPERHVSSYRSPPPVPGTLVSLDHLHAHVIDLDDAPLGGDDVFHSPHTNQQFDFPPPPSPLTIGHDGDTNNNIHVYRNKPDPDDPALILANILTRAHKSGERERLMSSTTHL